MKADVSDSVFLIPYTIQPHLLPPLSIPLCFHSSLIQCVLVRYSGFISHWWGGGGVCRYVDLTMHTSQCVQECVRVVQGSDR